jgi:chemotaxis protein histidine kinase CheA
MTLDTDVLKELAFWLGEAYKTTVQLSGIIYLHRITDDRMSGSSLRNLTMFKKLCGENAFQHVKLATTMWKNLNGPNLSYDTGVAREKELTSRKDWWGLMCDRGSSVVRHDGTKECAMEMIEDLIQRHNKGGPVLLEIQREMVDDKKPLDQTAAGQEVEKDLTAAKQKFEEQIADLQESYDEALKERDEQLAQVLREQRDDLEKKLQRAGEAQENLKITLEKLCEEKTAEYTQKVHELHEEKRQWIAEYAARQSELDRLQEKQDKDAERHREEREAYERQREEAEQRMQELLKQQKTAEAERAREDKEKLDRMQQQMEERFAWERQQQQQHAQAIQAQMQQLQQKPRSKKEASLMPLISLFAGVATSGIGLLTLNPAAVLSGIGTALDGFAGAGNE